MNTVITLSFFTYEPDMSVNMIHQNNKNNNVSHHGAVRAGQ